MSINLSKYIAAFDYIGKTFDKNFFICSKWRSKYYFFYRCYWNSCSNSKCKLHFCIFFNYRNNKETVKDNKKQKKKYNRIIILAKNKLNSVETLMSQALIDLEITHEEFKTIIDEKQRYEKMKENIRNIKSSDEKDELRKNSRNIK